MLSCFVAMSLLSNTPVAGVQTQGGGHRADMHLSESSLADTWTWVLAKNRPVPSDRGLQCAKGNCSEGRKKYEVVLNG